MPLIDSMETKINEMVDELQGLCASYGLANQASEEKIITNVFLYKFLNDKFMYNLKKFGDAIGVINYKRFLIQSYERQPMAA